MKTSQLNQIRRANKNQTVESCVFSSDGVGIQVTFDGDTVNIDGQDHIIPESCTAMERYMKVHQLVETAAVNAFCW